MKSSGLENAFNQRYIRSIANVVSDEGMIGEQKSTWLYHLGK